MCQELTRIQNLSKFWDELPFTNSHHYLQEKAHLDFHFNKM